MLFICHMVLVGLITRFRANVMWFMVISCIMLYVTVPYIIFILN
jgi:hypothetical protein